MATSRPRITITLTDHQHAVLSELSQLQKASMSSIVCDLIDTTIPVLERLADVLASAAAAPQAVLSEIRTSAELAEAHTIGMAEAIRKGRITGLLEQLVVRASEDAPTAPVRRRGVAEDVRPPTSNRGVRISSPHTKIESISPMKKAGKPGGSAK